MTDPRTIIIVGAGRSGTNLLRDILCSFPGFATWPCDEINYIWRHGNRNAATDELTPADARPEVARYIRRAFDEQRRRGGGAAVVEKTCATSLRVGFAHRIFPDAQFVFILRDGRDVVASAMQRWSADLDVKYLAKKARFVPRSDLAYYAAQYARSRLARRMNAERRLATWGPRFTGMDEVVREHGLLEACAVQWRTCVEQSQRQLTDHVDADAVHLLRYEDLVAAPNDEIERLAAYVHADAVRIRDMPRVSGGSVGKWRSALDEEQRSHLQTVLGQSVADCGYPP